MSLERRPRRDERGFALLLVLWSLVLLSLILSAILAAGRQDTQLSANLRRSAMAETIADSAVQDTIFRLLTAPRPPRSGLRLTLALDGGTAIVQLRYADGMVNPNMAPPELLTALLLECGASRAAATHVADAIVEWRSSTAERKAVVAAYSAAGLPYAPLGQPFYAAEEIRLVRGMPPPLADCLVPHLSVYGMLPVPNANLADATVLHALLRMMRDTGSALPMAPGPQGILAVQIAAEAQIGGAHFRRLAAVLIAPSEKGPPYRILTWQDGN